MNIYNLQNKMQENNIGIDISALNEKIENESAFIDLLTSELKILFWEII